MKSLCQNLTNTSQKHVFRLKHVELIVGLIGIILAWGIAGSQFAKTFRSNKGVSSLTWAAYLTVNISWLMDALAQNNMYLAMNTVGSAMLSAGVVIKSSSKPAVKMVYSLLGVLLITAIGLGYSWGAAVIITTLLAVVLRWPQATKLIKSPEVTGVSITT
jgi:membrane protein insertase Oxa1/YidC/SpoIIIJ